MKKLAKNYKMLQYEHLIKNHSLLFFYQLNCLSSAEWDLTQQKLKKQKLIYLRVNSNILKKKFKSLIFENSISGPLLIVFFTKNYKNDMINIDNFDCNNKLIFKKFKNKLYPVSKDFLKKKLFSNSDFFLLQYLKTMNIKSSLFFLKNVK